MENTVSVVIGSWGSYNECNERTLGSKWLDLSDFDSYEEIEEELTKEGFILDGIDEELFIQDIEGAPASSTNWDNMHPQYLFETLDTAGVLHDSYKFELMEAYCEINSFDDFMRRVDKLGDDWSDDIYLYRNYSWSDYGEEMVQNYGIKIPDSISNFIDYDGYGKYCGDGIVEEYSGGLIEIYG